MGQKSTRPGESAPRSLLLGFAKSMPLFTSVFGLTRAGKSNASDQMRTCDMRVLAVLLTYEPPDRKTCGMLDLVILFLQQWFGRLGRALVAVLPSPQDSKLRGAWSDWFPVVASWVSRAPAVLDYTRDGPYGLAIGRARVMHWPGVSTPAYPGGLPRLNTRFRWAKAHRLRGFSVDLVTRCFGLSSRRR